MTLHASMIGGGPPLVLLHGWLFPGAVWQPLATELARHYSVYCLDLPGYGANTAAVCSPYDMEQLVNSISTVVPPESVLIGWSLGALIAMHYACHDPQHLRGLVLVGATPRFTTSSDWSHGTDPAALSAFRESVQQDFAATIKRFASTQTKGIPQPAPVLRTLNRVLAHNTTPAADALEGGLHLLESIDFRSRLHEITLPTLVIHGQEDSVIPVAAGQYVARHIRGARWRCFSDSGHVPFVVQPRAVANAIDEFCHELQ